MKPFSVARLWLAVATLLMSGVYAWAADKEPVVSIQVNRHEVRAGQTVQVHESYSLPQGYSVISVGYRAEMLAFFHRGQKKNIYLDGTFGRIVTPGFIEGVERPLVSPHGISLTPKDDGKLGRSETIKPKVPGIYLISARLQLRNSDGTVVTLTSKNSTILLVAPGQAEVSELARKRWEDLEQLSRHASGVSEDGLP